MDPRKFVVNPKDQSCQEVNDYHEVVKKVCKIAHWHCHPNLFFVEAIEFDEWIFHGTLLIPVSIAGREFLGVAISQYNCGDDSLKVVVRTASVPVKIDNEDKTLIAKNMVDAFTPVGRELRVIPEDGYFSVNINLPPGYGFSNILNGFKIRWDGDPENN